MKMLDKIAELVQTRDWTEQEFESKAGLPQGRISKWRKADQTKEDGKAKGKSKGPSAKEGLVMARILEVDLEWLADDEANGPAKPMAGLAEDERLVLSLYRDLREEFSLTGEKARRAMLRAVGITTSIEQAREDMRITDPPAPERPMDPRPNGPSKYPPAGVEIPGKRPPAPGTPRKKQQG